jgi:hypothetical protein
VLYAVSKVMIGSKYMLANVRFGVKSFPVCPTWWETSDGIEWRGKRGDVRTKCR